LITPVLLIFAGLGITITGIGIGSRLSRRTRSIDHEGARDGGGLACGVVVLVGAVTVVVGIADGLFQLVAGP
jgi:hypothetical protein